MGQYAEVTWKYRRDLQDYFFQAKLFFKSKNIQYEDPACNDRILYLLLANLRGSVASWYKIYVSEPNNHIVNTYHLQALMEEEFLPRDQQERLRDQLMILKRRNFDSLEEYISNFRSIISRITNMSRLDKVMHFTRGMRIEIQEEVKTQRFQNTADAIAYALPYERAHRISLYRNNTNMRNRNYDSKPSSSQSPQPNHLQPGAPTEIGNT